jgi:hypothetical protein
MPRALWAALLLLEHDLTASLTGKQVYNFGSLFAQTPYRDTRKRS